MDSTSPPFPSVPGSGGPTDARGVALNGQLGLSGSRSLTTIDWPSLLPRCNASAPTAATCGPSAITFASASTTPYQAAYLGGQEPRHLLDPGERRRTDAVGAGGQRPLAGRCGRTGAHYAKVPAGCANCDPVTNWEPWSESNNTGWPNGATYVTRGAGAVLRRRQVRAARYDVDRHRWHHPRDLAPWWQQLVTAGGLADMDVAAVHPYTGLQRLLRRGRHPDPGRARSRESSGRSPCGSPRSAGGATGTTTSSARPTAWRGR